MWHRLRTKDVRRRQPGGQDPQTQLGHSGHSQTDLRRRGAGAAAERRDRQGVHDVFGQLATGSHSRQGGRNPTCLLWTVWSHRISLYLIVVFRPEVSTSNGGATPTYLLPAHIPHPSFEIPPPLLPLSPPFWPPFLSLSRSLGIASCESHNTMRLHVSPPDKHKKIPIPKKWEIALNHPYILTDAPNFNQFSLYFTVYSVIRLPPPTH